MPKWSTASLTWTEHLTVNEALDLEAIGHRDAIMAGACHVAPIIFFDRALAPIPVWQEHNEHYSH